MKYILPEFIKEDVDLRPYTTFGIEAKAKYFSTYRNVGELQRLMKTEIFLNEEVLHIGGGSNLLFVNDFDGLVVRSEYKGILEYESPNGSYVIANSGEDWDSFVQWTIDKGYSGLENLAGIPGQVGASAIQNVGAYGVEAGDLIHSVECMDLESRRIITLNANQCRFGYRDSMFKHEGKNRYIVLRVAYKLTKSPYAKSLDYGPLKELKVKSGDINAKEVAEFIREIRNNKLPDPKKIGSAGSFFINPVVSRAYYEQYVLGLDSEVPCYGIDDSSVKIPAGWLIDHAGLKGQKHGGAEVWPNQCLVIANTGGATAKDVVELADKISTLVKRKYGLTLRPEVNCIDTSIEVTILGSGTSKGVPELNCECDTCRSADPKDKRYRSSALVRTHGMTLLLDVSPDFRSQGLVAGIKDLDGVLITHTHTDHVGGFDDLRPFCVDKNIDVYLKKEVNEDLHRRLDYCFRSHPYPGVPKFDMHEIDNHPFYIKGLKIIPIEVMHGKLPILGYRIGDFGYITDAKSIDEAEKDKLRGLKVLVVNALRWKDHFAHFTIEEALELIEELKPEKAYLTHLSHEAGKHEELLKKLSGNVEPAYDGMKIFIE